MGSRGRNSWGQAILFLHPTTETRGRPQSVDPINPCDPCRRKRGHLHSQELANLPAGAIEANNGVLSCATPWGYIGIDLNISAHKEINDPLSLYIYIHIHTNTADTDKQARTCSLLFPFPIAQLSIRSPGMPGSSKHAGNTTS